MRLISSRELINNAWEGKNNCFVFNLVTNQIKAVHENRTYNISEECIKSVWDELVTKGINKYALEFRAANLITAFVIGRKKEFDECMKRYNLDKIVKPLSELNRR